MERFTLSVGEPWDFAGPDGPNRVEVELLGVVDVAKRQNRDSRYLLLKASSPFDFEGERVELLVASPRYVGETLESLASTGGVVGVARVLPGVSVAPGGSLNATDVHYCIVGGLSPRTTSI